MIRAMPLRSFLTHSPDHLTCSAAFETARHAMLRAMARRYPYLPHQMLEDAAMLAFEQLWKDGVGSSSPHAAGSRGSSRISCAIRTDYRAQRLLTCDARLAREVPVGVFANRRNDAHDDGLFDRLLPPLETRRGRRCRRSNLAATSPLR
jgi:hypothetical protein